MAARKRKPDESFKQYRDNLKAEESARKESLKGRMIWESKSVRVFNPIGYHDVGQSNGTAMRNPNGYKPGEPHYIAA